MSEVDVFYDAALSDPWFSKFYLHNVTPDFLAWWLGFYGTPEQYANEGDGVEEYFIRCAFALSGWKAKDAN